MWRIKTSLAPAIRADRFGRLPERFRDLGADCFGERKKVTMDHEILELGVDSAQIRRHEPDVYARITSDIATWLDKKTLEPPLVQTFPFDNFMEAFDAISSRRAAGKIVVEINS